MQLKMIQDSILHFIISHHIQNEIEVPTSVGADNPHQTAGQLHSIRVFLPETNRETSVIIPLLITVLFQIKTLITCVK